MKMAAILRIVGLCATLIACETQALDEQPPRDESEDDSDTITPRSPGEVSAAGRIPRLPIPPTGGGGESVAIIKQLSIFDGTTAVDVAPRIQFGANGILSASDASDNLRGRAAFIDDQGAVINVAIENETVTDPYETWDYMFWFSPSQPLSLDRWYWLAIEHDPGLPVWDAIHTNGEPSEPRRFHFRFFTGSAPHVVSINRDTAGPFYQFFTSEPISVGSAVGAVDLRTADVSLGGCVWRMGLCLTADTPHVTAGFDFLLNNAESSRATSLWLGGSVGGSGRTIAQSAALHGQGQLHDGFIHIELEGWISCPGSNGGAECWSPAPILPPN
jgi:hypothetical protein